MMSTTYPPRKSLRNFTKKRGCMTSVRQPNIVRPKLDCRRRWDHTQACMKASLHLPSSSIRRISVTNSVTNRLGNRGQSRAMKSLHWGKPGQRRGTEGNLSFGLITQRSKVQILPPQPIHSTAVISSSSLPETSNNIAKRLVPITFERVELVTARWVSRERP